MSTNTEQSIEHLLNVRLNDVYRFRYNEEYVKKTFEPYHCFDGTLRAVEGKNGIVLRDSYWGDGSYSRVFTVEEALKNGTLTFLCNLEEVEAVRQYEHTYYDDSDCITLFIHAGYRNEYYIKKGSKKSQSKMLETINQKIKDEESNRDSAIRSLERHLETKAKIEAGDTSVYM